MPVLVLPNDGHREARVLCIVASCLDQVKKPFPRNKQTLRFECLGTRNPQEGDGPENKDGGSHRSAGTTRARPEGNTGGFIFARQAQGTMQ